MRSPHVLALAIALALSACAQAPGSSPPPAGEHGLDPGNPDVREVQQLTRRDIPRDEINRIRQIIEQRRRRFLTPIRTRTSPRFVFLRYDTGAENEIRRLTDQARALSGNLSALQPNATLLALARAHSADMAASGQLSGVSSDGRTPADWLNRAGVAFRSVGVRVYRAPAGSFTLSPGDTDAVIIARRQAWINNSQGSGNPLDPNYYDAGVGVVRGDDGMIYITALYRQPPF